MPKFCLIVGGQPTARIEEHVSAPQPNPVKGMAWLPYINNQEPAYDPDAETLGPWTKATVNGQIVESRAVLPIPNAFALFQARQIAAVDAAAETCRRLYITNGAGQAMSYQEKAAEAKDCLANHNAQNPPPLGKYLILESEVGVTGADVLAVAAVVEAKRQAWRQVENAINGQRVNAKKAIGTAATFAAVRAIVAALTWPQPAQ